MAFIPSQIKSNPKAPKALKRILMYFILSIVTVSSVYAQQKIRVQGTIISIPGAKSIPYVDIVHDGNNVGHSDIDGKFAVNVPRDAVLHLHHKQYNTLVISVDGRQEIRATMTERIMEIEEAITIAEGPRDKIIITPTEIEVKGNYLHLKTRFRIPTNLFKADHRFIVQPTIYHVTKKKRYNLLPVVIDGKSYSAVQDRYFNYDKSKDKLNPYIVNNLITKENNIYSYADSMYFDIKDLDNDFRSDCYLTIVSYRPPHDYLDSLTIAKGLSNVLRFLDYSFDPMDLDKTLVPPGSRATLDVSNIDSLLIPKPEMNLFSDRGSTEIAFGLNKSTINYKNPTNIKNIKEITDVLKRIQENEYATLKSISVTGYSSPEGNFKYNKQLADKRTQSLLKVVTKSLSADILKYTNLSSNGAVHPWSKVVELIEHDSLPIAPKLRQIIVNTNDHYSKTQQAFVRLPEYRKLMISNYLPKLRKVEYAIEYTIFRDLSTEEIFERHRAKKELSRYEYFKLITSITDEKEREQMEEEAITTYPNFAWAVNRVAIRTLLKGEVNLKLQEPILGKDAPASMVYNQAIMALREKEVKMADSLLSTIVGRVEMREPKAVIDALNGNFEDAYLVIAEKGGLNEILLMLALHYNSQAYQKMEVYIQDEKNSKSGRSWYVYAICANRIDDISSAMSFMGMALKLDPTLADIAALDSDIMDIYELVKTEAELAKIEAETRAKAKATEAEATAEAEVNE